MSALRNKSGGRRYGIEKQWLIPKWWDNISADIVRAHRINGGSVPAAQAAKRNEFLYRLRKFFTFGRR